MMAKYIKMTVILKINYKSNLILVRFTRKSVYAKLPSGTQRNDNFNANFQNILELLISD